MHLNHFCHPVRYQYLEFYWDEKSQLASIFGKDGRGKVVQEILNLNRKDLRKHRSDHIKKLISLFEFAKTGNQEAIEILRESCKFDGEYSAFLLFSILPYLAHDLELSEAKEMIKEVSQRSPSYAKFYLIFQ
jgi:hypothetical protein